MNAIREAVGRAVADRGPIVRWSGPFAREWSWQFLAETAGRRPGALIIKVPRWEETPDLESAVAAGPQADTAAEFAALEVIRDAVLRSGDAGLAAITPVAYVPEVNAIVTERLNAVALRSLLGWRTDRRRVESVLARLGRWLSVYHHTGDPRQVAFDATPIPRASDAPAVLKLACERLEDAGGRLAGRPVWTGTLHGDLTLGNVLVSIDDRVAVVDPNRGTGRFSEDAAHLLAEVRLGRPQMLSGGLLRRPATVSRWADTLVGAHPLIDPEVARFDEAVAAVSRWVDFLTVSPSAMVRIAADRVFAGQVKSLVADW